MAIDVVVLFALEREARPFRRLCPNVTVALTAVGVERARAAIDKVFADSKPRLVILAGFGGALTASAKVGDIFIAKDVCDESGAIWPCHAIPDTTSRVLTVNRMIATVQEKLALGAKHAADVCDMESGAVAEACRLNGVPFLAVRTISDTAEHSLPLELDSIIVNGEFSKRRAFLALLKKPRLIGEFWKLMRNTDLAAQRLALFLKIMIDSFNQSRSSPSSSEPRSPS